MPTSLFCIHPHRALRQRDRLLWLQILLFLYTQYPLLNTWHCCWLKWICEMYLYFLLTIAQYIFLFGLFSFKKIITSCSHQSKEQSQPWCYHPPYNPPSQPCAQVWSSEMGLSGIMTPWFWKITVIMRVGLEPVVQLTLQEANVHVTHSSGGSAWHETWCPYVGDVEKGPVDTRAT